jgi:hypothetical protein
MNDELKKKVKRIAANHRWEVGKVTLHEGNVYVWATNGKPLGIIPETWLNGMDSLQATERMRLAH